MAGSYAAMSGKVCLVTGATSGIGEATARGLARLGATVIVASRSQARCTETAQRIRQETGNQAVEYLTADLSSQAEIRRLAGEYQRRYDRLDVLVNNAGGFFLTRQESPDGIEMTFALNHISYFLLTDLLLEVIKTSEPARIVNVSSNSHRGASIDFEDLQGTRSYSSWQAYGQSKLANVLHAYELARRLEGTRVSVNALHPGFVATRIGQNNGWLARLVMPMMRVVARSPEEGARTSIYLASSAKVEGVSGKFFEDEQAVPSDPASYDQETARKLWEVSQELVGIA